MMTLLKIRQLKIIPTNDVVDDGLPLTMAGQARWPFA